MITKISAGEVPDLFYVNAEYAPEWIDQGFLEPLDDYIAKSGLRHEPVLRWLPVDLQGQGREDLRPAEGRQHHRDGLQQRPRDGSRRRRWTSWSRRPRGSRAQGDLTAPICLNPGLDRGLAFLYAQGGELVNADGTASAIDTEASKAAVQWYLDLFKNGLGMTAADMGSGLVR